MNDKTLEWDEISRLHSKMKQQQQQQLKGKGANFKNAYHILIMNVQNRRAVYV